MLEGMEVNPYLVTTGGLFRFSWETDLNKSYVMSQQIYIDFVLQTIINTPVKNFQKSDFDTWLLCKQLYENIRTLVNDKLNR